MTLRSLVLVALLWAGMVVSPAEAQQGAQWSGLQATRPELEALLARLDAAARDGSIRGSERGEAQSEASAVRARLAEGDFEFGDRILLKVDASDAPAERGAPRSVEQQLSDTFTVGPDRAVRLPVIGGVALRGVLRSELEGHLAHEIARFIKDPTIRARPLIRLSVVGAVSRPGFYFLPADALVTDVLTAAGGLTPDAKVPQLRIERVGQAMWEGKRLQTAMAEGQTVDEMHLRAGDQFVIPEQGRGGTYQLVRTVAVVLSIPITVFTLTKIF